MKYGALTVSLAPAPDVRDDGPYCRPLAAFADGPVADTAEPVAAEAGRPIPEPDRDDTHTMGRHERHE